MTVEDEIQRSSMLKLSNIRTENTTLQREELLAFVSVLTAFLKDHCAPDYGSFSLYAWADDKEQEECVLSFNFKKGKYEFHKKHDERHSQYYNSDDIVTSSLNKAFRKPVKYIDGVTDRARRLLISGGRLNSGYYHETNYCSVMVARSEKGRFYCAHFAKYDNEEARSAQAQVMLATMWILCHLRQTDQRLQRSCADLSSSVTLKIKKTINSQIRFLMFKHMPPTAGFHKWKKIT